MSGKGGSFHIDPAAARKTASQMHEHGEKVTGHGRNLKARTGGRVGHGEIGQVVDQFVTTAMTGVTEAFTKAASDLSHGFGKGLESVAQRAEKADAEAAKALRSLDRPHPVHRPSLNHEPPVGVVAPPLGKAETRLPNGRHPEGVYTDNGMQFTTDRLTRTTDIEGPLGLNPHQGRNPGAQLRAGGTDRLHDDEGGHGVGRRFNGSLEEFNHFAQNRNFNRGTYKVLENSWQKELGAGNSVYVHIKLKYPGDSMRPGELEVQYEINNGGTEIQRFFNRPGGK